MVITIDKSKNRIMDKLTVDTVQPKVSIRNVDVFYGQAQAVHDVSMDIPEHKVTALIGPSGAENPRSYDA